MENHPHRNYQNLQKIGPVYSTCDEKQRAVAEEINNFRLKPQLILNINMNIPGLDKKKIITPRNPDTMRFFGKMSSQGKYGWRYLMLSTNIWRFLPPALMVANLWLIGEMLCQAVQQRQDHHNYELEGVYQKLQGTTIQNIERFSLMA